MRARVCALPLCGNHGLSKCGINPCTAFHREGRHEALGTVKRCDSLPFSVACPTGSSCAVPLNLGVHILAATAGFNLLDLALACPTTRPLACSTTRPLACSTARQPACSTILPARPVTAAHKHWHLHSLSLSRPHAGPALPLSSLLGPHALMAARLSRPHSHRNSHNPRGAAVGASPAWCSRGSGGGRGSQRASHAPTQPGLHGVGWLGGSCACSCQGAAAGQPNGQAPAARSRRSWPRGRERGAPAEGSGSRVAAGRGACGRTEPNRSATPAEHGAKQRQRQRLWPKLRGRGGMRLGRGPIQSATPAASLRSGVWRVWPAVG